MAAVFANQGWGQFTCALVSFFCTIGFKDSLQGTNCGPDCQVALDKAWRIIYKMGAVPALIALYFRLTMPESIRYTFDVAQDDKHNNEAVKYMTGENFSTTEASVVLPRSDAIVQSSIFTPISEPPKSGFYEAIRHFSKWRFGSVLLGTAGSWLLLDIAF